MKQAINIDYFQIISYPANTILVTSIDDQKNPNIITIAWHTTISKKPPLYGISIAPTRHSRDLIESSKEFVINFLDYQYTKNIHCCGTKSGRKYDKSKTCNLTYESSEQLSTPRIKEGYAHLECTVYDSIRIGDHIFIVGEIKQAIIDKTAFDEKINMNENVKPTLYLGNNRYSTKVNSHQIL